MSIEFNRRTFLKTSAALIGGGVLLGLTGCDSSSSASHSINKKVGNDPYKFGDVLTVAPVFITLGVKASDCSLTLAIKNCLSTNSIAVSPDAFSASYKGKKLPLTLISNNAPSSTNIAADTEETIIPTFILPVADASSINEADLIFKFHYNNQSIKFQKKGDDFYTSGVYNDKDEF